jgi:hypothetical protein
MQDSRNGGQHLPRVVGRAQALEFDERKDHALVRGRWLIARGIGVHTTTRVSVARGAWSVREERCHAGLLAGARPGSRQGQYPIITCGGPEAGLMNA